jgi:transcriptional regulator with XRE-family HTH domain
MKPLKAFGANVKRLREALGATIEQLAEAVGVPVGTARRWENGSWRVGKSLESLCIALDVTPSELYEGVDYRQTVFSAMDEKGTPQH